MRLSDWPGQGDPGDELPRRPGRDDPGAGLPERLARLPAGHPSGADAPDAADDECGELASHLPWPDDWVRGDPPGPDAADADQDLADAEAGPDPAGPPDGQGAIGMPSRGPDTGAAPGGAWVSQGPYRPWFTGGDALEPWFTTGPADLLAAPDEPQAADLTGPEEPGLA
jgi:hypothetical protein